MSREALATYLNDHLAGSVGAVELVERVIEQNQGTPLAAALTGVLAEIREEQQLLRDVLQRLDAGENPIKKAGAWLAEKAGRLKLGDTGSTPLARMEALEALAVGIQGKLALWRALEGVATRHPELAALDLARLQRQGRAQFERVDALRLEAARDAL